MLIQSVLVVEENTYNSMNGGLKRTLQCFIQNKTQQSKTLISTQLFDMHSIYIYTLWIQNVY